MYKVSVIVPIFKVERYVERCVRSLMEQTLVSLEYIFVNDATPDNSMAVLNSVLNDYPNRKDDIVILEHPFNKGLPAARQTGIAKATGEYIIHCDSDDYVDTRMYEKMYQKAKAEDLDLVVSGYYEGSYDNWNACHGTGNYRDIVMSVLENKCSVWNKLFRSSIVNNPSIVPPKANMAEDLALVLQYALLTTHYGVISEPLYYYDRHPESILGQRNPDSLLIKQTQFIENFNIAIEAIKKHGLFPKYRSAVLHECVYIKNYILPALPFTDSHKQWRDTYREVNSKVLFSRLFTVREKMNFIVTHLGLYPLYYKLTHRNA